MTDGAGITNYSPDHKGISVKFKSGSVAMLSAETSAGLWAIYCAKRYSTQARDTHHGLETYSRRPKYRYWQNRGIGMPHKSMDVLPNLFLNSKTCQRTIRQVTRKKKRSKMRNILSLTWTKAVLEHIRASPQLKNTGRTRSKTYSR